MRQPLHPVSMTGIPALALLLLGAAAAAAQDGVEPFASMKVSGGVMTEGADSQTSVLSFAVDFTLGPNSDGFVLGGRAGEPFAIETSIGIPPGAAPPGNLFQTDVRRALELDIAVDGSCFDKKNGRFRLRLRDPQQLDDCVTVTLQLPGFNPMPLDLLEAMEVTLWRRGRPDRWRMRSRARFTTPIFGYPVAGFGPDTWTALVIGNDRGQAATSAVAFEGSSGPRQGRPTRTGR